MTPAALKEERYRSEKCRHQVTLWALSMPILYGELLFGLKHLSFHDEMTVSQEGVCSPPGPRATRLFGGMHADILRAIVLVNVASTVSGYH